MKIQITFILALILLTTGFVSAYPGIPHQFYGSVTVNGNPAPDNNVLVASIDGDSYATVTKDGKYGYSPNIFYVEDPDGDRSGKTINFYLGGKNVGSVAFENNGYTKFDISTTTTCGDTYCLGSESCSSCSTDCGICTSPPVITISSPENKVYDTLKVGLLVSSDQPIIIWMYALNSEDFITFTPNITLTAKEGNNEVGVIGLNKNFQTGTEKVTFSVELPKCGNGRCEAEDGETCSSCSLDCGTCPAPPPSGGGGGGGSGGGGGGGGSSTTSTNLSSTTSTSSSSSGGGENNTSGLDTEKEKEESSTTSFLTGAVTGIGNFAKSGAGIGVGVFIVAFLVVFMIISSNKKRRKRK